MKDAFGQYASDEVAAAMDKVREENPLWPEESAYESLINSLKRSEASLDSELEDLGDSGISFKRRRTIITPMRNMCRPQPLDDMLAYLRDGSEKEMRLLIAETLGWYVYSCEKTRIVSSLEAQSRRETDPEVKNEIAKTLNRLSSRF